MFRYQILIEYVGSSFIGWQVQTKGKTIQGLIQKQISYLLNEKITLIGSGRTDTGVHAIEQSAHFDIPEKIQNLNKFLKSINYFLNKYEIAILKIKKKNIKFHARFSAKKKIYKYIILNRPTISPIYKNRSWLIKKKLDINKMKKAIKYFSGTHNFSSMRASSCSAINPIRTITKSKIMKKGEKIIITFESKSFLQKQVRSMVGCLKFVGEKKWKPETIKSLINSKKRKLCAPPAPPDGLYLEKVFY